MKKSFLFFVVSVFYFCIFSNEYKINEVKYNIVGNTKESALERTLNIDKKIKFTEEGLLSYIEYLKQELYNTRTFSEVKIDFTYNALNDFDATNNQSATPLIDNSSPATENSTYLVTLTIFVVDSSHFLILPYYKYDSNDGNVFKAKLKDNNFLGIMNPMESEISFALKQEDEKPGLDFIPGVAFKYDLPFRMARVNATWLNDYSIEWTIGNSLPEWDLGTGLKLSLPFKNCSIDLTLMQGFVRNEDYLIFNDDTYFTEKALLEFPIKLETISGFGSIYYVPSASLNYIWDTNGINKKNDDLTKSKVALSHKIMAGKINWNGNFRKGILIEFGQDAAYNFDLNLFQPGLFAEVKAFYSWKYVGINSRLYAYGATGDYRKFGERLRGVKDKQYFSTSSGYSFHYAAKSTAGIILNLDVPIHLFNIDWEKLHLPRLNKFNFEVQIAPFIDIALTDNRATGRFMDARDGFYTAGLEVLVFPEHWKSIQIRASAGFDLSKTLFKNCVDTSWRDLSSWTEFSFGLGLFY